MRKMLLVIVASSALVALAPATALAQHRGRHHARHARIRHRRIGHDRATTTTPTTTPSPAATVASYDSTTHVLTLTLAGGSTVSGTITNDTRLVCAQPPTTMQPTGSDHGAQGDQGGDRGGWGGSGWGRHDRFRGRHFNRMCTTSNLTTGAPVQFADLSIGQGGANWDIVVLAPTTTTTS
jgi:hypothetical protein